MTNVRIAIASVVMFACNAADDLAQWELVERKVPTISSVATSDGFTQVCSGCTAELVITGERLNKIDSITLSSPIQSGVVTATVVHASSHTVRARLEVPHATSTGLRDVGISGRDGEAIAPDAIEITPIVVGPSASPDGRGTFQSPVRLCNPPSSLAQFDTLLLLAGAHSCDRVLPIPAGVTIIAEAPGVARVVGTGTGVAFDFQGSSTSSGSAVFDLAIEGVVAAPGIRAHGGIVFVGNVVDRGGIRIAGATQVQIREYRFDGPGTAIALEMPGSVQMHDIAIDNCSEGITLDLPPDLTAIKVSLGLQQARIAHCDRAIRVGSLPPAPELDREINFLLQGAQLIDNTHGILIQNARMILADTAIRAETTPSPVVSGIRIENGSLSMSTSEVSGATAIGVEVDTASTAGQGNIRISDSSIVGGRVGVRVNGFDRQTIVELNRTKIRDQTEAAAQLDGGPTTFFILGESSFPFGNALSVTSGFALDDRRTEVSPFFAQMFARGTALNGHAHAGELLQGPLTLGNDIRIVSPQVSWQF